MSYQSGDKKNILGNRLSNRYLSSDAFTSSAGKTGGRSISRLGSLFSRQKHARRFSGTGQKIGLFEVKNVLMKLCVFLTCAIVLAYTFPFTRYSIHGFFASNDEAYANQEVASATDELAADEKYVAPFISNTDRFSIDADDSIYQQNGSYVYASPVNTLVGIIEASTTTEPQVVLFSDVGFKNNLFMENVEGMPSYTAPIATTATTAATVATGTEAIGTSTESVEESVIEAPRVQGYSSIIFEGLGYGQMLAKVPPQVKIPVGTILYARTIEGLKPAGKVSYIETDTGSTFTNVYAQILTAPYSIYKIKLTE